MRKVFTVFILLMAILTLVAACHPIEDPTSTITPSETVPATETPVPTRTIVSPLPTSTISSPLVITFGRTPEPSPQIDFVLIGLMLMSAVAGSILTLVVQRMRKD